MLLLLLLATPCAPPADRAGTLVEDLAPVLPKMDSEAMDGWFAVATPDGRCMAVPVLPGHYVSNEYRDAIRLAGGDPETSRVIVHVGGVRTSPEEQCAALRAFRDATGAVVIGIHNATRGGTADLREGFAQGGRGLARSVRLPAPREKSAPVRTLRQLVVAEALEGRGLEVFAHSQGATIASLALFEAKSVLRQLRPRKPLDGIRVTTFGGATPVWPDGPRYEHYVSTQDPVARFAGLGSSAVGDRFAGAGARIVRFSGDGIGARFRAPDSRAPLQLEDHELLRVYLPRWKEDQW